MKIARIEVSPGACEKCQKHAKDIYWIPDGKKIEDIVDEDDLPPYHPNCKCRIVFEDIRPISMNPEKDFLTKTDMERIVSELDAEYQRYKAHFDHFGYEADALWYFGVSKMCNERASELESILEAKLKSIDVGMAFVNMQKKWVLPHA